MMNSPETDVCATTLFQIENLKIKPHLTNPNNVASITHSYWLNPCVMFRRLLLCISRRRFSSACEFLNIFVIAYNAPRKRQEKCRKSSKYALRTGWIYGNKFYFTWYAFISHSERWKKKLKRRCALGMSDIHISNGICLDPKIECARIFLTFVSTEFSFPQYHGAQRAIKFHMHKNSGNSRAHSPFVNVWKNPDENDGAYIWPT